jgi:hypothetical protein
MLIRNLPDTLLGNAKNLSQRRYRLASFVAGTNFSIARTFGESAIGNGELRAFQAAIWDSHRERHRENNLRE